MSDRVAESSKRPHNELVPEDRKAIFKRSRTRSPPLRDNPLQVVDPKEKVRAEKQTEAEKRKLEKLKLLEVNTHGTLN